MLAEGEQVANPEDLRLREEGMWSKDINQVCILRESFCLNSNADILSDKVSNAATTCYMSGCYVRETSATLMRTQLVGYVTIISG